MQGLSGKFTRSVINLPRIQGVTNFRNSMWHHRYTGQLKITVRGSLSENSIANPIESSKD